MIHLNENIDGNVPYEPDYINYTNMTTEYQISPDYLI